ncbi:MAG: hypothetical protein COA88_16040, partial [Kordia sp.]
MKKITLSLIFLLGSLSLMFGQTYTMTNGSNTSENTCSGTFVDSGGSGNNAGSNYGNNESSVITFCPSTPGDLIQIDFTQFETEVIGTTVYDYLEYWNANSNAGVPDNTFAGSLGVFSVTSTSPDGCVTFEFTSDGSTRDRGWEATISCFTPCTVPIASLDSTPIDICGPTSITPGSLTVSFDASGSTANAPETVVSYEWDFGDGNTQTTATSTTNHIYASTSEIYLASVDVIDSNGCKSTNAATKLIRVFPEPNFSGTPLSYNVSCGDTVDLVGVVASQTETQEIPAYLGSTTPLPDGTGVSFSSTIDFTGFFASGATMSSTCYPVLTFDIEHSATQDLEIILISPSGQSVVIFDREGPNGLGSPAVGFGTCVNGNDDGVPGCPATYTVVDAGGIDWTDAAAQTGVTSGCAGYTGVCDASIGWAFAPVTYNSTNPFSGLDGSDLNGIWTIEITDHDINDDGTLESWSLSFPPACYSLETVTPNLVTATWSGGGTVSIGAQSTTSTGVTDPGPDLCPGSVTCTGTQLTNSPTVGPFNTPAVHTYTLTIVDEFGCEYEQDVIVTATCSCILTLDTANSSQTVCEDVAIVDIVYTVGGDATGINLTGTLPPGVNGTYNSGAGTYTISGTPTSAIGSPFNYTITTVGCTPNLFENGTITVNANPIITDLADQEVCDSYVLPAIAGTNVTAAAMYYTGAGGTGTAYAAGATINYADFATYPVTLYLYEANGTVPNICSDEEDFALTINLLPIITDLADQEVCDSYVLPVIAGTNVTAAAMYYTGPGGTGIAYAAGATINYADFGTYPVTLYLYEANGTGGMCSDEEDFTLTINLLPIITDLADQEVCDSYVLPAIVGTNVTAGAMYYTGSGGTGTAYAAGATINYPDFGTYPVTLYLYEANGTGGMCSDEEDFVLTINLLPIITDLADQEVCDSYVLPAIVGTNVTAAAMYYTGAGGTGTVYAAGATINYADFATYPVTL